MSPEIEVLTNWLRRTREDLRACRRLLAGPDPVPDSACFHPQPAAEKALKAFPHWSGQRAPRTHALEKLIDGCATLDGGFAGLASSADSLTPYAAEVRYGSSRSIPEEKGRNALALAEKIVEFVVGRLVAKVDLKIAAEGTIQQASEERQISALRAELEALERETGKDKRSQ